MRLSVSGRGSAKLVSHLYFPDVCGIAGKIDFDAAVPPELLAAMCESLVHRGPDAQGIYCEDGVGLGIQRLAVIDLETGDPPIFNEDESIAVVLNGEIYNYLELRRDLIASGHQFRTDGDTETIVHLYEELGDRCVAQLRGMFAFALWDKRRRRLLLARDRVGKKPLFYRVHNNALWFASEPRAIFRDESVPRRVDYAGLDSFLRLQYVPHPQSAFEGIRKLPPGHVLTWDGGQHHIARYWNLEYRYKTSESFAEAVEEVRDLVLEATRLRLRSDVAVGAFLSGGVDSSAVVAAMAKTGADPLKTFSIGFDDDRFDETRYAKLVADRYGTEHYDFHVTADAVELLPKLVWHYGEPFADSSAIPSFYLSELTRQHVTVALNGDGGDESFAGYTRYLAQLYSERLDLIPVPLRRGAARLAATAGPGGDPRTVRSRLVRALGAVGSDPAQRYDKWMSIFSRAELAALYTPEHAALVAATPSSDGFIEHAWASSAARSVVDRMLDVDVQTYLPGDLLVKMDIATMAHSLEVRSPLLDHVLMERLASFPGSFKLRPGRSKLLLKEAVRPWLPDDVIDRPKMGFGVPIASWFRGDLKRLPEAILLDPVALDRGMFRPSGVRRLIEDHVQGVRDNSSRIWALLQMELWFRTYIDQLSLEPGSLDITVGSP